MATLRDLLQRQGLTVSEPVTQPAPAPAAPTASSTTVDLTRARKVVLRRERKGRGGKTATVVSGLGLRARDLETVARTMKRALGCGAHVEGDDVVLHGDLAERAQAWLAGQGVAKIVLGN